MSKMGGGGETNALLVAIVIYYGQRTFSVIQPVHAEDHFDVLGHV